MPPMVLPDPICFPSASNHIMFTLLVRSVLLSSMTCRVMDFLAASSIILFWGQPFVSKYLAFVPEGTISVGIGHSKPNTSSGISIGSLMKEVTSVSFLHRAKALSSILVMVEGIVKEVISSQFKKASKPIHLASSGIIIEDNLRQPEKAFSSIRRTPSLMFIEVKFSQSANALLLITHKDNGVVANSRLTF